MRETVKFWIAISAVIYLFDLAFYTIFRSIDDYWYTVGCYIAPKDIGFFTVF